MPLDELERIEIAIELDKGVSHEISTQILNFSF